MLRQLGDAGYVERVGDLWMIRKIAAVFPDGTADRSAHRSAVEVPELLPAGLQDDPSDEYADGPRLHRLVRLADAPVDTVTHDRALGDILVRGEFLTCCLADACGLVVLRGCSSNVYLPREDDNMIVGLRPVEAARALFLQWNQSGTPPELPHLAGWFFVDDGFAADFEAWAPRDADDWGVDVESWVERMQRQRAAAGLG